MKTDDKQKSQTIRAFISLLGIIFLCYLQAAWSTAGMPTVVSTLLWTIYAVQIFVLSCRLFKIKISTFSKVLSALKKIK